MPPRKASGEAKSNASRSLAKGLAPGDLSIPSATYRLQLTKNFTFDDAAAIAPYLKRLGVSHLYASPFLKARAGSTHGYDIVDHNTLNPELGGEEGFARLSDVLRAQGLGLILDFVPNHMGVGLSDNAWWLDVLEWGAKSPYARFFDIAWESLPFRHGGGVLLPILGRIYGDALEAGDITLRYDAATGEFSAWYFDHRLPISPQRYGDILRTVAARADGEKRDALIALANKYAGPHRPSRQEAPALKAALAGGGHAVASVITAGLAVYDPKQEGRAAAQALHRLLERQHYRLAHWRIASSEINYRRFFDVNDLAGLRMEDMQVFAATHRLVIRLIAEGRLQGLRLDHVDGLQNPAQYTERLLRLIRRATGQRGTRARFYVLIEKILGEGEPLPPLPGVAGTTGYEWLNEITRVLLDPEGVPNLLATARDVTGESAPLPDVLLDAKHTIIDTVLASEFTVLARMLARIAAGHWSTRDFTQERLSAALRLYVLNFPVYRTYITTDRIDARDRTMILDTIARARKTWSGPDGEILDFLADALTLDLVLPDRIGYSRPRVVQFSLKLQQFTGPLMAKSLEDTAFYRYMPLLALNEVGGWPDDAIVPDEKLHAAFASRAEQSPHGLTATATHDTKRGEDTRARLTALSELAPEWNALATRWLDHHAALADMPSPTHAYLLYQTVVAAWPLGGIDADFCDRLTAYAIKAAREGKRETSWIEPNEDYENTLRTFVARLLDAERSGDFLTEAEAFARRLGLLGALNSLAQLTLKAMLPGVPDFYQGTELWDFSLVDPDNRRPVDYRHRTVALESIDGLDWSGLTENWADGRVKLRLTRELLALRERHADVFARGGYKAVPIAGRHAGHVFAFERRLGERAAIVFVARRLAPFANAGRSWPNFNALDANATVHVRELRDSISGRSTIGRQDGEQSTFDLGALFDRIPVVVCEADTLTEP